MQCQECEHEIGVLPDPRTPPLEPGNCMCLGCFQTAAVDEIERILEPVQQIGSVVKEILHGVSF